VQSAVGAGLGPVAREFLAWKEQLLPRRPMSEAISYTLSQWQELNVFSVDGAVPIDINVIECGMKLDIIAIMEISA
jgi:hypothetical protein